MPGFDRLFFLQYGVYQQLNRRKCLIVTDDRTIHLVNGIRTGGAQNVDRLKEPLEALGYRVCDVELPRRFATARFKWASRKDAAIIADKARDGDVAVGHSYGGSGSPKRLTW